jgi:hypothetical protein
MLLAALALSTPLPAREPIPPPPSPEPEYAKVKAMGEASLKSTLFDPGSAQIVYFSGFQWGYAKPIIGRSTWGWIACGTINAKNRLGGFVGAQGFWIMSDANGAVSVGAQNETISTCDSGKKADLQPELKDADVVAAQGNARLGVAEELSKLAELRETGNYIV